MIGITFLTIPNWDSVTPPLGSRDGQSMDLLHPLRKDLLIVLGTKLILAICFNAFWLKALSSQTTPSEIEAQQWFYTFANRNRVVSS